MAPDKDIVLLPRVEVLPPRLNILLEPVPRPVPKHGLGFTFRLNAPKDF